MRAGWAPRGAGRAAASPSPRCAAGCQETHGRYSNLPRLEDTTAICPVLFAEGTTGEKCPRVAVWTYHPRAWVGWDQGFNHEHDLARRGGAEEPVPGGHLPSSHPWLAGMPAAKRPSPAWQGCKGSSAGAGLIHPSQPRPEGAAENQAGSPPPRPCLFWTAVAQVQSLFSFRHPVVLRSPSAGTGHTNTERCFQSL